MQAVSKSAKSARLGALMSLFTVCALTACGGGGSKEPTATTTAAPTPAAPAPAPVPAPAPAPAPAVVPNTVTVVSGAGKVTANSYPLDTTTKAYAYLLNFLGGKLQVVSPTASAFDVTFRYLPSEPGKYVIGVIAGREVYACRSNAWTADELAALDADKDDIAICTGTAVFEAGSRHIQVTGVNLRRLDDITQQIAVNADFNWQPLAIGPFVTVEPRSTNLTIGANEIEEGEGGSDTYGGLQLGITSVKTSQVNVSLSTLRDHPEKYVVAAQNLNNNAIFACISATWTSDERTQLRTALKADALQTCPDGLSFDTTSRLLTLDKVSLPSLAESMDPIAEPLTLVLSLSRVWEQAPFASAASPSPSASASPALTAAAIRH